MTKQPITKISMNLPDALIKKIDDYALSMNINRTSAICVLLNQQFKQDEALKAISDAVETLNK